MPDKRTGSPKERPNNNDAGGQLPPSASAALLDYIKAHWIGPVASPIDGKTYDSPETYAGHLFESGVTPHENAESPHPVVGSYSARRRSVGQRYFSEADIEKIIATCPDGLPSEQIERKRDAKNRAGFVKERVPRRKALEERLEQAAQNWHVTNEILAKRTPKIMAKSFKAVETAANDLLIALGLPNMIDNDDPPGPIPPALRYGGLQEFAELEAKWDVDKVGLFGSTLLHDAVQGVYRLRDWSSDARSDNDSKGPVKRSDRNLGDIALNDLFVDLAEIWVEIFNRKRRASITKPAKNVRSQSTGPMVRFYSAALRPVLGGETPEPGGIRGKIRKMEDMAKSPREKI